MVDWKIRIFNNFPPGNLKVPYCCVIPWELSILFSVHHYYQVMQKNKNVFSFKYYFVGNYLLKVNNKDIKVIFFVDFEQVCGHVANILYSLRNLNTCSHIKSNEKDLGPNLFQTTLYKK